MFVLVSKAEHLTWPKVYTYETWRDAVEGLVHDPVEEGETVWLYRVDQLGDVGEPIETLGGPQA